MNRKEWVRWTSAAVLVLIGFLTPAADAQAAGEPVTVVSHVDVIPDAYRAGAEESAQRLFRVERAASLKDAGVVSYVVLQEISLPNHFTFVETWHDARSYELHVGSAHTVKFRRELQPFLGSPFDTRVHRQLHE